MRTGRRSGALRVISDWISSPNIHNSVTSPDRLLPFSRLFNPAHRHNPLSGHRWGSVLVAAEPIEKWYNMRRTSTWVDWEDDCCWHREETIRDFLLVCKPNYIHDYFQDDWRRTIWEKKWGTEQGREEDRWGRHAVYYIQGVFFSLVPPLKVPSTNKLI